MRMRIFISTFILLTISCWRDDNSIKKIIFASVGSNCTYDSLKNPQLILRTYIEYSPNTDIKIAKGDDKYEIEGNESPFRLDKFFKIEINDSLKKLIQSVFVTKSYDSLYIRPGSDPSYVIIYETYRGTKQIIYNPDCLPQGLDSLHSQFYNLTKSSRLTPINSFSVNNSFIEWEKQLFRKHPPPIIKVEPSINEDTLDIE